jgi:hypothetical protein
MERRRKMKSIWPWVTVRRKQLAFHKEVDRLIKLHPEYLEGIERGTVHIKFRPGYCPNPKKKSRVDDEIPAAIQKFYDEQIMNAAGFYPKAGE